MFLMSSQKYDILAYADKKRYVEEKEKWVPPIDKKPLDSKKKPSGKAKTAYALWSAQERAQLTQTHPDIDKREATKLIRDKWRMIPEEHKAVWIGPCSVAGVHSLYSCAGL